MVSKKIMFSMIASIIMAITLGAQSARADDKTCCPINGRKICVGDRFMHHYSDGDFKGSIFKVYADGTVDFQPDPRVTGYHFDHGKPIDDYTNYGASTFTNPTSADLVKAIPCLENGICVGKHYMHHYNEGALEGVVSAVYADGTVKFQPNDHIIAYHYGRHGLKIATYTNYGASTFTNPTLSDLVPIGCSGGEACHSLADKPLGNNALTILEPRSPNTSVDDEANPKSLEGNDSGFSQKPKKTASRQIAI